MKANIIIDQKTQRVKLVLDWSMSRETPSCFKNVMVGVCSLYGEVPQNTGSNASTIALTPQRLYGNCTSRMPEYHATTFKRKFEAEVKSMLSRLHDDVVKIVLWTAVATFGVMGMRRSCMKLYDGFEKLLDFHHAMEHISQGAEGLFGKSTKESQRVECSTKFIN